VDDSTGMRPISRHFRNLACRRWLDARSSLLAGVVAVCLTGLPGARADETPPVPRLPDLVRTASTAFAIPFKVAPSQQADQAATRVLLQVSKDLGGTWEQAGEAAPEATSIVYKAGMDGEYWFRLRAIDAKGRQRGGEGPDMRVLVDAAAPRISARVWRGTDGEIVCRYAAADDTLDLPKMVVEYQTKAEPTWKKLAAEAILSRESPAHLLGEEIWWAGEKVEALSVRISVSDAAGHRTVKQFTMEPSDPGVDQGMLAAEIGVPALPGQTPSIVAAPSPAPAVTPPSAAATDVATVPRGAGRPTPRHAFPSMRLPWTFPLPRRHRGGACSPARSRQAPARASPTEPPGRNREDRFPTLRRLLHRPSRPRGRRRGRFPPNTVAARCRSSVRDDSPGTTRCSRIAPTPSRCAWSSGAPATAE
jgi:hypothetical protein